MNFFLRYKAHSVYFLPLSFVAASFTVIPLEENSQSVCASEVVDRTSIVDRAKQPRSREECLKQLKSGIVFDILLVGAGATGSGAALDAAARGLSVACVEREDFASGTSSRSTKLIWAGSRYLVNAFVSLFNADLRLLRSPTTTINKFMSEVKMVMNCHRERRFLLEEQPHLTNWVPIAVPISKWILWPPPFGFFPAALVI